MNSVEKSIEEIEKMIRALNKCADENDHIMSELHMAYMGIDSIDPKHKEQIDEICAEIGQSMTQAISTAQSASLRLMLLKSKLEDYLSVGISL